MMKSEQINELAAALAKAQGEIRGAVKDAQNPFFKSNYADLSSVWEACRPALEKHGLSVTQPTEISDRGVILNTLLMHSSGQWVCGQYPVEPIKKDPQGLGAAITYARRYSLAAIVGVCSVEDDDAESAMDRSKAKPDLRPVPNAPAGPVKQKEAPAPDTAYRITFGKFIGKTISQIPPKDLLNYCAWLEADAQKKNKPMDQNATELIARVNEFMSAQGAG